MQLLSFALSYSLETVRAPFELPETVKNSLNNNTVNIFPIGTILMPGRGIEVLVFQPNCK